MEISKLSEPQIIGILKQADCGGPIDDLGGSTRWVLPNFTNGDPNMGVGKITPALKLKLAK